MIGRKDARDAVLAHDDDRRAVLKREGGVPRTRQDRGQAQLPKAVHRAGRWCTARVSAQCRNPPSGGDSEWPGLASKVSERLEECAFAGHHRLLGAYLVRQPQRAPPLASCRSATNAQSSRRCRRTAALDPRHRQIPASRIARDQELVEERLRFGLELRRHLQRFVA